MLKLAKLAGFTTAPQSDPIDVHEIEKKIEIETSEFFRKMVKLGAFCNILGAFLYVLAINQPEKSKLVIVWYSCLLIANVVNVIWAMHFEHIKPDIAAVRRYRQGAIYAVMVICLLWGSIAILFMSDGGHEQMTTLTFLCAVLICFSFSTAVDLRISIISITCLLTPATVYYCYLILLQIVRGWHESNSLNVSIASAFLMLGFFMLIASFVGNKVVMKMIRLGYENSLLNQKLSKMNSSLERRVKERTHELEKSLKLVTYQSTHDLLTELPNERLLCERIQLVTEKAIATHHKFAIVCFSLNGMKKINDGLGHQAADTVIKRIAHRFNHIFKNNDNYFVSITRRNIFIILIEEGNDSLELQASSEKLFLVLNDPIYVERQLLKLTASIGVSIFPDDGRELDILISKAETARTVRLQNGGNSLNTYNEKISPDALTQLNIENHLYHAIAKNEFFLTYQPFIDIDTGMICGAEALIRWQSPVLGLVPPLDFIPIAETNGMILPIGEWVLLSACQELKKWQKQGLKSFKISVNLSAKQLVQKNVVETIRKILHDAKLNPKYLELELTESEAFNNEAIPIITELTNMGISLAIDDFGTGYSELSSLKLFRINKIKIDKLFIQDININVDSKNIVWNTIELARRMNIECLAEGVETIEQLNFLKSTGCHVVQGYYFSKPLNSKDFYEFLKTKANFGNMPNPQWEF